jgi:hypothetical protein
VLQYRQATGDLGEARFDYTKNNGAYLLQGATFEISTSWSGAGHGSIHAYTGYAPGSTVAYARFASDFHEIDDPGALDYSSHNVTVREGEIAVFQNRSGYALVRIRSVLAGPAYGDDRWELAFDYALRKV